MNTNRLIAALGLVALSYAPCMAAALVPKAPSRPVLMSVNTFQAILPGMSGWWMRARIDWTCSATPQSFIVEHSANGSTGWQVIATVDGSARTANGLTMRRLVPYLFNDGVDLGYGEYGYLRVTARYTGAPSGGPTILKTGPALRVQLHLEG